ncbi:mitochondrial 54S ribosomal protein YmL9 [Morchella snyderi]|nr:mitochondrial 54S ribosomal protein YmL9 [Morchella snyderi]
MPPKTSIVTVWRHTKIGSLFGFISPLGVNNAPQFSTSSQVAFGGVKMKRVSSSTSPTLLAASKAAALERRRVPQRVGALAFKKEMTAVYLPNGQRIPCTILQLDRVQVMAPKNKKEHGYWACQVGLGWKAPKNITKPMLGHYEKFGVAPKKTIKEFRVKDESGILPPGTIISADHFVEGQYVDIWATCKGKGFAGGMKRHGWGGQPASHGNSLTHRAMGSAGQSQGGGSRVYPGKRMAGRMGGHSKTIQHRQVLKVDRELGVVLINGPIPGPKGGIVSIQDTIHRPSPMAPEDSHIVAPL